MSRHRRKGDNRLDRAFAAHDSDIGQKMGDTLVEYDRLFVEPLRKRLDALEAKPKRGRPRKTPVVAEVATEAPSPSTDMPA